MEEELNQIINNFNDKQLDELTVFILNLFPVYTSQTE